MYLYFSIGRECIDGILEGVENISGDITKDPETASELVAFNFMLDGLESRVAFLEERLEYLRELYDLMGEFNIPIPPEDMTQFLGINKAHINIILCTFLECVKKLLTSSFVIAKIITNSQKRPVIM